MIDRLFKDHVFRQKVLNKGYNKHAVEILTYIDAVTHEGTKAYDVFEDPQILDELGRWFLKTFEFTEPHLQNINKLYTDEKFKNNWVNKYNKLDL